VDKNRSYDNTLVVYTAFGQLAEREKTTPSRITVSMLTQKTTSSQQATNSLSLVFVMTDRS
jgi:hypothetical protein